MKGRKGTVLGGGFWLWVGSSGATIDAGEMAAVEGVLWGVFLEQGLQAVSFICTFLKN